MQQICEGAFVGRSVSDKFIKSHSKDHLGKEYVGLRMQGHNSNVFDEGSLEVKHQQLGFIDE